MSEPRLIVGLGNPGKSYEKTRHNLGFLVIDSIIKKLGVAFQPCSFSKGAEAKTVINGTTIFFFLPLTFMNNSGGALRLYIDKRSLALENILVVCDDFNLGFGQLRLRRGGSDGGHNGLASVIEQMGSSDITRLRVGIGEPDKNADVADYVLTKFTKKEQDALGGIIEEASECCLEWVHGDIEKVMSQFNKRMENE